MLNKYPYTDFHDINLDWFLSEFEALKVRVGEGNTEDIIRKVLLELADKGILGNILNDVMLPVVSLSDKFVMWPKFDQAELEALNYDAWISLWDSLPELERGMLDTEYFTLPTASYPAKRLVYYTHKKRLVNYCTPELVENFERNEQTAPTLFITMGIHGNEKQGPWAFYQLFKAWLRGECYGRYILDNFNLVIVPCVNPYGWSFNNRYNERDVNINRNFVYNYDEYKATHPTEKCGDYAASEPETQFCIALMNKYSDPMYRSGLIGIDLHGFHRDLHTDDNRVLWVVANDRDIKAKSLQLVSALREVIARRYPDVARIAQPFARWAAQVSVPDFDNEFREYGLRNIVFECPQKFGSVEYDDISMNMSFLIVPNVVLNLADEAMKDWQGRLYKRSWSIGARTGEYSLLDLCKGLTNGSQITLSISTAEAARLELPGSAAGILQVINNGGAAQSLSSTLIYTVTDSSANFSYAVASMSAGGIMSDWHVLS